MKTTVSKKKQLAGMVYGLIAGLAFAIFAWGVDAYLLARAHGAYAWVKILPGLIICLFAGGLVGWLTTRVHNTLYGLFLWIALALLYSRLVLWLPIRIAPAIIKVFNGALGDYLKYPFYKDLNQNLWFGFATIAIVAIVCGLLENLLVDQALFSSGSYAMIVPLIVCFLCFTLAGNAADSLLNKNLRTPVQAVDTLLQFAQDNIGKEVPKDVARSMHLASVNTIKEFLPKNRKLILSNFDQSMGQVDVLVDFSGKWVKCTTIYNQVTFCKPAIDMPWIRLSSIYKLAEKVQLSGYFPE